MKNEIENGEKTRTMCSELEEKVRDLKRDLNLESSGLKSERARCRWLEGKLNELKKVIKHWKRKVS